MPHSIHVLAAKIPPRATPTPPRLSQKKSKSLVGRASSPARPVARPHSTHVFRSGLASIGKSLFALPLLLCLAGCASTPPIETAGQLAQALKDGGIAYESAEPFDFSGMSPAKIDEGLGLTGPNLEVAILRITDERTYKQAANAAFLLAVVKDRAPNLPAPPPDLYLSQPFAVIIRLEPQNGQVRAVLKKILKEDQAK